MADPEDFKTIADAARFVIEDSWELELEPSVVTGVSESIERWSKDVLRSVWDAGYLAAQQANPYEPEVVNPYASR